MSGSNPLASVPNADHMSRGAREPFGPVPHMGNLAERMKVTVCIRAAKHLPVSLVKNLSWAATGFRESTPKTGKLYLGLCYWRDTRTRTSPLPFSSEDMAFPRIAPWPFLRDVAFVALPGIIDVVKRSPGLTGPFVVST